MQTIQPRLPANVFGSQQSKLTLPKLSSEIVRPVFDEARRGLKRAFSHVDTHLAKPPKLELSSTSAALPSTPTSLSIAEPNTTSHLTMVADCADQLQQKPKRVRHKTQRRREQCRANQARYRQKQLNHSKTLEEAVQKLRADIPVLELQRNRLFHGDQQSLWNVVVEYFHNFRFGVPVALPLTMEGEEIYPPSKTPESVENAETKNQLAFLWSSMTDDVILGKRTGVEALMEQWRLYSSSFQNLYLQLDRVERTSDQFVSVSAMLKATVSKTTLEKVFPHLNDEALQTALLGQSLQIPCSMWFEWDAAASRVSRLETTMNFVTSLVKVLGNLVDVATVLEQALITQDGVVGIRDA